jgi:hypothetical protein
MLDKVLKDRHAVAALGDLRCDKWSMPFSYLAGGAAADSVGTSAGHCFNGKAIRFDAH